jgi:outer membrane assembly lipoprotein YfiO
MGASRAFALALAVVAVCLVRPAPGTWVYSRDTGRLTRLEALPRENASEQFQYAAQFEEAGKWSQALVEYRKVVRHFPDSVLAPRAQFSVGRCYQQLGKLSKAFDAYQVVLDKYPSFAEPDEVIKRQFKIATAFYDGRRKRMPLLGLRIGSGRGEAIRLYEQIALNAPFGPVAEEAKYRAGELLERKKRFDDYSQSRKPMRPGAINTYLFVVENFEDGERRDDALFRVGECYYRKARRARHDKKALEQALLYYRRYQREFPKGEYAEAVTERIAEVDHRRAESGFQVGIYYEKRAKYRAALMYYEDVVARFPLSPYAEEAKERAETMRERLGLDSGGEAAGADEADE